MNETSEKNALKSIQERPTRIKLRASVPPCVWYSVSRLFTIVWGFENKNCIIKNIVIIIHVPFTEVWQPGHGLHLKPRPLENLIRQVGYLFFPRLSFYFQVFFGTLPLPSCEKNSESFNFDPTPSILTQSEFYQCFLIIYDTLNPNWPTSTYGWKGSTAARMSLPVLGTSDLLMSCRRCRGSSQRSSRFRQLITS